MAVWVAMNPNVQRTTSLFVDNVSKEIVWLDVPGPGGGGGGGGNKMPEPIKKAELKGQDKITVPGREDRPLRRRSRPKHRFRI